jgi:hypothetical protein
MALTYFKKMNLLRNNSGFFSSESGTEDMHGMGFEAIVRSGVKVFKEQPFTAFKEISNR